MLNKNTPAISHNINIKVRAALLNISANNITAANTHNKFTLAFLFDVATPIISGRPNA